MNMNSLYSMRQHLYRPFEIPPRRREVAQEKILHEPSSSSLFAEVGSGEENNSGGSKRTTEMTSQDQSDPSMFFELMSPITSAQPDQMSASSLAYLGDVVFELFIRSRYVWPSRRMPDLQNKVVSIVRGTFIESFPLTSAEQGVLARGRNANLTARKKGKSVNSAGGASAYQDSTAFEALIGYTYISDKNRFNEMISWMKLELDDLDSK
ncbi:hypothetical protein ACHAXR_003540 [Thalassiosira sp. AJA248-18]